MDSVKIVSVYWPKVQLYHVLNDYLWSIFYLNKCKSTVLISNYRIYARYKRVSFIWNVCLMTSSYFELFFFGKRKNQIICFHRLIINTTLKNCKRCSNWVASRYNTTNNVLIGLGFSDVCFANFTKRFVCRKVNKLFLINISKKPNAKTLQVDKRNRSLTLTGVNQRI